MKEEMSSFDIAVITIELDRALTGFRINNIYQVNPKTLLLNLRGHEGLNIHLVLEAGRRVHTTSYVFEKPKKPPDFCMALRKYLRNGRIEKIQQHKFERIIEMVVTSKGGEYHLITELFGEGNIVLVNSEKRILHALSYRRMRDRNILRGEDFNYPPLRGEDPRNLSQEDLYRMRGFGQLEVVRAVARFLSIGGLYAEEVLLRTGVNKKTPCSSLEDEHLNKIFISLRKLLSEIKAENIKPSVFLDEKGNWIDVAPIQLKKYAHLKYLQFQTFNEALDEFHAKAWVGEKVSGVERLVEREVAKLERILQNQKESLHKSEREAEVYRKLGETIYLHLNEIQILIQRVMRNKRDRKTWKEIVETLEIEKRESRTPAVYFKTLKPRTLMLQVSLENQLVDLDLRLSAQKNAAKYYAKAKRAERKIMGLKRAMEQTQNRISETKLQIVNKVQRASKPMPKKEKREWYEKFRWFYSSDDFLVVGGKDASTNEILIKKYVNPQDLIFHAEFPGAPFVIIKTKRRKPPERTINEAARFAASYSRAWKESISAVNVYWVLPDQVSKTPPSGEYLPRGSFMITGSKNYIKGVQLEVAVGIKREGERYRVVGGPLEAIAEKTGIYVRLVPGRESSGKLAKQIRGRLAHKASNKEREEVLRTPLDEIQNFIPSGRGAIR